MRISTGLEYSNMVDWIDSATQNMATYQAQASTGKAYQTISQDPYAATQALGMQSVLSSINQYASNISSAKGTLTTSENALTEMQTLMQQANTIAIAAANATTSQSARTSDVSQIQSIQDRLVSLANSQGPDGQYIFAGQANSSAPFTVTNGNLVFNGDKNDVVAEVGPSNTIATNTQISDLMTKTYSQLNSLKADLTSGNTSLISKQDIANTTAASSQFTQLNADVGVKLDTLSSLSTQLSTMQLNVRSSLSDNQNVDMASAISNLQAAQTTYQAALSASSITFKTNLLNYITFN